ncbi:MAG: anhydro-N-acetylmuramic acid kinase [Phycisphaerales bacterium]|nr:anhydro-N-acetylmuramic acid kinase [Phycisphaerales bacterium]
MRIVLGLMSGTSGDGVDMAAVAVRGTGQSMRVRFLWHEHRSFGRSLRRRLLEVMAPATIRTEELARLNIELGNVYGRAVVAAINKYAHVGRPELIGVAGQTVCHLPDRRAGRTVTFQIGEPARVAAATGLCTVGGFRQSDTAAGGQGAPLVPWTDWILMRSRRVSRAIQNIGGIGNVTWLPAAGGPETIQAFDTGPGNMLIDALAEIASGGRQRMDRGGQRAARGRILEGVLKRWMKHPFLRLAPPRTTGRETFGKVFVEAELPRLRASSRSADDWLATATAYTARSIAEAYRRYLPGFQAVCSVTPSEERRAAKVYVRKMLDLPEIIVCGGGAHNPTLLDMLSMAFGGACIRSIDSLGIPAQAKEAVSFAILAAARMDLTPANVPKATGARQAAVLGQVIVP